MPGIFGFIRKHRTSRDENQKLLKAMCDILFHHHSYKTKLFSDEKVGLGIVAVSCYSSKHESVSNYENGPFVLLDGEIYEFRGVGDEINSTDFKDDAQRIVYLYESCGNQPRNLANKLNGEFNIVIYDHDANILTILNDRFGFRKLYYYHDDNIFIFSPEIKAILTHKGINKAIDLEAFAEFFKYSYIIGSRTFFKHILRLDGATVLNVKKDQIKQEKYWKQIYIEDYDDHATNHPANLIEEATFLLNQSLKRRVKAKEKIAVSLSGGLDSRLVLALVSRHTDNANVKGYTYGVYGNEEQLIASKVAERLGIKDYRRIFTEPDDLVTYGEKAVWLTEGMLGSNCSTALSALNKVGRTCDLMLGGFAGDLILGGWKYTEADIRPGVARSEEVEDIRLKMFNIGERYLRPYFQLVFQEGFLDLINSYDYKPIEEELSKTDEAANLFFNRKDMFFIYNHVRKFVHQGDLDPFFGEEALPFFDYDLIDFVLRLHPTWRVNHRFYIGLYKAVFPNLARIPWMKTGVSLYEYPSYWKRLSKRHMPSMHYYVCRASKGRINWRDKSMAVPFDQWFRIDRKFDHFVENILLDPKTINRGLYKEDGINELLRLQRSGRNCFHIIDRLIIFEVWNRYFVDGEMPTFGTI